jgi:hypothetical protein
MIGAISIETNVSKSRNARPANLSPGWDVYFFSTRSHTSSRVSPLLSLPF